MTWSLFKSNKGQSASGAGGGVFSPPAPFFNVMPKAKFRPVSKTRVESPPPASAIVVPVAAPIVASVNDSVPAVPVQQPVAAPIIQAPSNNRSTPISQKRTGASPKAVQIVGVIIAILLALGAIWYAADTFGDSLKIPDSIKKLWSKIPPVVEKDPNTSLAGPQEEKPPIPPVAEYKTSSDWRVAHFGQADCDNCGDAADGDKDGLPNSEEYTAKTNPTVADTDGDGLADGDEAHVFGCSPANKNSAADATYTDADDLRGGWNCSRGSGEEAKLTESKKADILAKSAQFGFHEPTITTLGSSLTPYQAGNPLGSVSIVIPAGVDTSSEATLDRDVQRLNTIRKIGGALLKYRDEMKKFPPQSSFEDMANQVKPFNPVATNPQDPINKEPFVYGYELSVTGDSFVLFYVSETQKQRIRYSSDQAAKDLSAEDMQVRDQQRQEDLERLRSALLIYSAASSSNQAFTFPSKSEYGQKISPQYIQTIPKDPKSGQDYQYEVSSDAGSFTLKALLEKPQQGTTGYLCNQEECRNY